MPAAAAASARARPRHGSALAPRTSQATSDEQRRRRRRSAPRRRRAARRPGRAPARCRSSRTGRRRRGRASRGTCAIVQQSASTLSSSLSSHPVDGHRRRHRVGASSGSSHAGSRSRSRKSSSGGRPGSASQTSSPRPLEQRRSSSVEVARARRARRRRARGPTAPRSTSASGLPHAACATSIVAPVALGVGARELERVRRPVGREHARARAAPRRCSAAPGRRSRARARAGRRATAPTTARASATPLGHSSAQYGMSSSRSNASSSMQRLAVARAQHGQLAVAQRHDLLDQVHVRASYRRMPLAYVFWHWPPADADPAAYEQRLRAFHARARRWPAAGRSASTARRTTARRRGSTRTGTPSRTGRRSGALNERAVSGAPRGAARRGRRPAADGAGRRLRRCCRADAARAGRRGALARQARAACRTRSSTRSSPRPSRTRRSGSARWSSARRRSTRS